MRAAPFFIFVLFSSSLIGAAEPTHWAFQKPTRPPLPNVETPDWGNHPIDAFITARQKKQGLKPVRSAKKSVLFRRISLDLTGLPPTRQELQVFLDDSSPNAYEQAVDRLLKGPQYGERWGRHWMDVWRYSDWYGRRAVGDVRNSYPHLWRWRDWIVRSLNEDKGYDRMVEEMLAADEFAPRDDENIVALGFIARNWFSLNGDQWMKDLVEHTGKAFLGLRLNCAHCHDHKYDPISQKEYFRFRAFFEPLEMRHDRVPGGPAVGRLIPFSEGGPNPRKPIEAGLARVFDKDLSAETYMYRLGDARDRMDRPPVSPGAPAILGGDDLEIEPVSLPPTAWYPGLKEFIQREETDRRKATVRAAEKALAEAKKKDDPAALHLAEAKLAQAQADLKSIQARIAADNARYQNGPGDDEELALSASRAERELKLASARLQLVRAKQTLIKARKSEKSKEVDKAEKQLTEAQKSVASARENLKEKSSQYTPLGPQYPEKSSGRRRALAHWIASESNPLTARVAVNHIWMRHFGRPLVESVFDFGRSGKAPSHPQLLDWLAVELMESGWSMKHLHRLIVTSRTYQLSSQVPSNLRSQLDHDSENRFYWRYAPRRMEAEVIRDSLLYLSGELDTKLGGPELDNKKEATSRRRSLYFTLHPEAGGTMKFLSMFDPPDPCGCYRRTETVVPQQALAMANSNLSLHCSRVLARELVNEVATSDTDSSSNDRPFIKSAFLQILSRRPTPDEIQMCRKFLDKQRGVYREADLSASSGKSPDGVTAPSADPVQRAYESLVHALFNHDQFVTIR